MKGKIHRNTSRSAKFKSADAHNVFVYYGGRSGLTYILPPLYREFAFWFLLACFCVSSSPLLRFADACNYFLFFRLPERSSRVDGSYWPVNGKVCASDDGASEAGIFDMRALFSPKGEARKADDLKLRPGINVCKFCQ